MLQGIEMPNGSLYNPVKDKDGNWFIFDQEFEACGMGVLSDFIPPISDTII
ncbi:hypothetical protein [Christiangramia sp.]|uniref:hypothetical protein n=1 Tax=Christiangramia sp. TaxID=1931228 RepID=UPI0032422E3B